MRIYLHIGLPQMGADRLQQVLADKRDNLRGHGILVPSAAGKGNHTRLFMAVTDPDHVDSLRWNRGFFAPDRQASLRSKLAKDLARDIAASNATSMILTASQLGAQLHGPSEIASLHKFLSQFSDDIRLVAHIDEPAAALARHYAAQVMEGRTTPLTHELALCGAGDWWQAALDQTPANAPLKGQFHEIQGAPFWLDYPRLQHAWEAVFGAGSLTLRAYDPDLFYGPDATQELRAAFDITPQIGKAKVAQIPPQPSAATLARARQFNTALLALIDKRGWMVPRRLWRSLLQEMAVAGDPLSAATLTPVSKYFAAANRALLAAHPALPQTLFKAPRARKDWQESSPEQGFRAAHYLLAHLPRLEAAHKEERAAKAGFTDLTNDEALADLSPEARALMPPLALQNFATLQGSPFKPHNSVGTLDDSFGDQPFAPLAPRQRLTGSSGNVIVGCMKNEAPYILEWVAYHRAIGIDNFLIYTNGCEDGTDEILGRLQQMGILEHRNNDDWRGNSPQQFALNRALKEPVIQNADWVIHIDVDEFINVRCGNGTLQDFFDHVPDATNVAMTWRLFGNNGVDRLADQFVIDQFDHCAPKYCPKPHTVWGFKTMVKNIGAYDKLSCHRPNKLVDGKRDQVKWVNGSGQDMTREAAEKGWRSSRKSIGYDLLQLNHYALRSAESFLIKRQRGRALHVDRSIGLNYWIRMDWSDHRDTTIKRNLPRLRAEYDRLLQDEALRNFHEQGLAWHRAKVQSLHSQPEFAALYKQARGVKLNSVERVAYALALDMES
ncbi:glycosyltransferase family 2 protein [Epibacterium sp. SM1979]|uniref:Glycosyltransferase family 2 protein n=1 Tax=Tritonibacter litoralis TaxID=2662264 RepID=A0A843Y8X0_9RHOB|nr:glycosyltransferase family 2 protein [Tritonibacter litoralis]MQQ07461.1 glycosyltransferase family 2 protein [Tritonibacter litoralis]